MEAAEEFAGIFRDEHRKVRDTLLALVEELRKILDSRERALAEGLNLLEWGGARAQPSGCPAGVTAGRDQRTAVDRVRARLREPT